MSQAPQQFCVRWNSYHTNLQTVFPKLLTTENFVDVTLACENRQIKCHKVVLSACSTYFERLLIQNPCKHPIIFMKDMRFSEMQSLVDFMYKGEVNVSQDDLPSLLKSAEALQIRGLCGSESAGGAPPELPVAPAPQIAIPLVPSGHMTEATSPRDHADNTNHSSKTSSLPPPSPAPPSTPSPVSNGPTRRRRTHLDPPSAGAPHATNGERSPPDPNNSIHNTGSTMKLRRADSLKQETVEEDGLYYGDIDLGEMDCSDQAEEDLLQTGNISGQPTAVAPSTFPPLRPPLGRNSQETDAESYIRQALIRHLGLYEADQANQHDQHNLTDRPHDYMTSQEAFKNFFLNPTARPHMGDLNETLLSHEISVDLQNSKSYKRYTSLNLKEALIAVKNGASVYGAAKKYGIPKKTLRNWMQKYNIKSQFSREKKDARMHDLMNDTDLINLAN